MSRLVGRMHLGNDHAKPEARSPKLKSIRSHRGKGCGSIKRGPEKGPVSMETVDKRILLDVDAGKAVKESMVHAEQAYAMEANLVNQIVKLK